LTTDQQSYEASEKVREHIAFLAASMVQMHMEALEALGDDGMTWQDVAFATVLSLRSLGMLRLETDEAAVNAALQKLISQAMQQPLLTKRFANEEEMQTWVVEAGLEAPPGPVH
jgi:hypothetical protein